MRKTENNTIVDKLKQGCLFPLYIVMLSIAFSLIMILVLNCEGRKSQEAIDDEELEEMIQYHRSEGHEILTF